VVDLLDEMQMSFDVASSSSCVFAVVIPTMLFAYFSDAVVYFFKLFAAFFIRSL